MNTKHFKTIVLSWLAIILLVITGCFPKTDTIAITPYFRISEEFASYCWFETGSYWVFQNDSTLITDTVKVINIIETKRFHNLQTAYNYEAVEMFTNSNNFDITEYELTAGSFEVAQGEMNSLFRLYKSDGSYQLIFLPEFAFGEEIIMGDEIGTYTNIEFLDTLDINNRTYSDVYHTRVVVSVNNSIEYNYWIAKNHSLIKATSIIDGQTTSISLKSDHLIGID